MFDRRAKNAMIFNDTSQMYKTNEILKTTVENSIRSQQVILTDDVVNYEVTGGRVGEVVVSGKKHWKLLKVMPSRVKESVC